MKEHFKRAMMRVVVFMLSTPSQMAVYRNSPWRSFVHDLPWCFHLLACMLGALGWWLFGGQP